MCFETICFAFVMDRNRLKKEISGNERDRAGQHYREFGEQVGVGVAKNVRIAADLLIPYLPRRGEGIGADEAERLVGARAVGLVGVDLRRTILSNSALL
ncbi:MAG: hypothetical protein R3D89_12110 [Sphingomonadaceae bacterium]